MTCQHEILVEWRFLRLAQYDARSTVFVFVTLQTIRPTAAPPAVAPASPL